MSYILAGGTVVAGPSLITTTAGFAPPPTPGGAYFGQRYFAAQYFKSMFWHR